MGSKELLECLRNELNFASFKFRRALASELGVSKMVVDDDLIPTSGIDLIRQSARIPLMIGVARSEWANKKAQFYDFHRFGNVSIEESKKSVRKIINEQYDASCVTKLSNTTLSLVANLTWLRFEFPQFCSKLRFR
ncbi:hypothetical protein AB6A40_006861 [Gnathostoma spinigerum]|uniref:Uncharacterized protein n=1 Tax=Gnathostoma spinigerum TaxID=75299 RepID=A0ABD6EUB8_9BILA